MTLKAEEAKELVELSDNRKRILMVGHLLHYHPAVMKIKELIARRGYW
jgi:UDP-2-acetamido-3-amino-2,3-dideoxy-glucuronate N-acetyltransferase